jgi:flavodoxin
VAGQSLCVGLAIDEDQQEELTEYRVDQWCLQIEKEFE